MTAQLCYTVGYQRVELRNSARGINLMSAERTTAYARCSRVYICIYMMYTAAARARASIFEKLRQLATRKVPLLGMIFFSFFFFIVWGCSTALRALGCKLDFVHTFLWLICILCLTITGFFYLRAYADMRFYFCVSGKRIFGWQATLDIIGMRVSIR